MDALRNILVLMEPGSESQPAFDAALLLARRFGARLELLMTDYQDLHAAYFSPPTRHGAGVPRLRDGCAPRACSSATEQRAAAAGVPAICEALWGTPFHEMVLGRVAATRPDLVVKHSVHHNRIERTLFTGSDWHLIRDCPAPLLLVKAPARLERARSAGLRRSAACARQAGRARPPPAAHREVPGRSARRRGARAARVLDPDAGHRRGRCLHRSRRDASRRRRRSSAAATAAFRRLMHGTRCRWRAPT